MEQNYVALQGKTFTVELPSNLGSTNYGWCIKGLPKDFVMLAAYNEPADATRWRGAAIVQKFVFGVVSSEIINNDLEFVLICYADLNEIADSYTAKVRIVPCGASKFTSYSENANVKYGYSCGANDANLKYGYPCGANDANLKYGYPCGANDANLKYGYPCGANDANLKYGYPCEQQDMMKDARPYGMVYSNDAASYDSQRNVQEIAKAAMPYGVVYDNANTPFFSANTPFFSGNTPFFSGNTPFFSGNTPFFKANTPFFNKEGMVVKYGYPGCC